MRYLAPDPIPANELPRPMTCFGTEPFRDVTFYSRGAEYNSMGDERRDLTITREAVAPNGYGVEAEEGTTLTRTMVITGLGCNGGMSDRDFGMSISMFTQTPAGNSVQTGCCMLQVN